MSSGVGLKHVKPEFLLTVTGSSPPRDRTASRWQLEQDQCPWGCYISFHKVSFSFWSSTWTICYLQQASSTRRRMNQDANALARLLHRPANL
jgi:hypothetical protein